MAAIDSLRSWDNREYAGRIKAQGKSFSDVARSKSIYNQLAPWYDILISQAGQTATDADFLEGVFRSKLGQDKLRLIDFACGSGRHANLLAQRGHSVVGVDSSPALLRYARAKGTATFIHADIRSCVTALPADGAYCVWDSIGYLSSLRDLGEFLDIAYSSLRLGGLLLIDTRNYANKPMCVGLPTMMVRHTPEAYFRLRVDRRFDWRSKIYQAVHTTEIESPTMRTPRVMIDETYLRMWKRHDFMKLLGDRFEIVAEFGDMNQATPYVSLDSRRWVSVYRRN